MSKIKRSSVSVGLLLCHFISFPQGLPIKPARTVSFATTEGSYMDVDVSPDGKTLAFTLLGDLYSIPVTGGQAKQLTRGIALNVQPRWSPEGNKIACVSDFSSSWHVNVIDLATGNRSVLGPQEEKLNHYERKITWVPDGNHIVAMDSVFGLGGGKLGVGVKFKAFLGFSKDGRKLYGIDSSKVYSFDRDTRKRTVLSAFPDFDRADYHNAVISPDARWLCFVKDAGEKRQLIEKDLTTGNDHVLVSSLILNPEHDELVPFTHFCITPDSKNVIISYRGKLHSIGLLNASDSIVPFIAQVNCDLGPLVYNSFRVTHDPITIKYTRNASTSPDGKQMVFAALGKIYIMNLRNGKPRLLSNQSEDQSEPVYSPDGKWIAYVSWNDTIGGHLCRIPATGGRAEQLTKSSAICTHPAWSPDGNYLAWVNTPVSNRLPIEGDIFKQSQLNMISPIDGKMITIDGSVDRSCPPSFSVDGKRVMFQPFQVDLKLQAVQLVSKDLLGNNPRDIVNSCYLTKNAEKIPSPDGRFIVYSRDEDLYLAPVYNQSEPSVMLDYYQRLPLIRFANGIDPYWEKGGKILAWTYGDHLYKIDVDKIVSEAGKVASEDKFFWSAEGSFVTAWIKPDKKITIKLSVPSAYAHGLIALKDARILTMKGDQVIEHGTLVIDNGRIAAVGSIAAVQIPASARIFNMKGTTIMPGMIDLHLHMTLPVTRPLQQSWMFLANLAYGVTTARDPAQSFEAFGWSERLSTGQMIGPRLFTVGRPVIFPSGAVRLDNPDDARNEVSKRVQLGGTVVKNYLPPDIRIKRQWLLLACADAKLNMTNEGYSYPIYQLGMFKDGSSGVEHNPTLGDVYNDFITLYAKSGTWFTPTLQVASGTKIGIGKEYFNFTYWHQPDAKLKRYSIHDSTSVSGSAGAESIEVIENIRPKPDAYPSLEIASKIDARIRKLGGRVTLGSHGNDQGIGAHNELWALQMGGLTNMQALQAATIMGAEGLGVQKDLGSLEVGKIADLIILNKNPLDDIHNSREIRYVMKDGVLYDGDTLDEIWPVKKKCPEWRMPRDRY